MVLLTPVVGLGIAGLAIAFQEGSDKDSSQVLFSGQDALPPLIQDASDWTVGALVLLVACKALAYVLSLSSFRGGPVFPGMFIGAAGGIALSHLPGLPMIAGAAMGTAAVTAAMLGLPLTAVLLTVIFLQADGLALTPLVIVSAVVAYVLSARLMPKPPAGGRTDRIGPCGAGAELRGSAHVPLARILGNTGPARGAALQARALADRPEPPLEARRRDDERRRVRRRLVRRGGHPGPVQERRAGLERPQPPRARGPRPLGARLRAHPRLDGHAGAADQLPSVSPRPLAVDAQRLDRAVPGGEAGAHARRRPVALRRRRGLDRLGGVLLPRAHARPRGRPARGRGAGGRPDRADRAQARDRAPDPDDRGHERRPQHLGVPLLERRRVAVALLLHEDGHAARAVPGQPALPRRSRTRRGSSSRSRSATSSAPGTRCPSRATASSSPARTSCTRSFPARPGRA